MRSPSRRPAAAAACLAPLAIATVATVLTMASTAQEKDTAAGSAQAPAGGAEEGAAKTAWANPILSDAQTKKCDELYARVRGFHDKLPTEFTGISGKAADDLSLETEKTTIVCGQFLAECEGHPKYGEVEYVTARLLFALSGRRKLEWVGQLKGDPEAQRKLREKVSAYMGDVDKLARGAFEKLAAEHPFRPRALQLSGQACGEAERHEAARDSYAKFLELFPKDPEADRVTTALARTFLDLKRYDEGIQFTKAALERLYSSEQYPNLCEILWKLHHSKGDLDGMMECVKRVDAVFPLKLSGKSLKPAERDSYERILDFNGFRRGYTLFAKGDFAGARKAFRGHVDGLTSKQAALQKEKKNLKPEVEVYQGRSMTLRKVVEELAGLPAPAELDLETAWATEKKVRVAESRGKVMAVVFRGVGDERSAAFLGPFSQLCARQPGLELVTISYRRGAENLAKQLDEMREELARLGYDGAAGFDPDAAQKAIFRAYQANVGSATLVILNRRGELVWYMQDPREVDVQFAAELLRRTAEK